MHVALLTAGGDCPGLNAVIRATARKLINHGHTVVGSRRGYEGLVERDLTPLTLSTLSGILPLGGTILQCSSFDPYREPDGIENLLSTLQTERIDAVVAIGGEHTMDVTRNLYEKDSINVVGVPKTIDNDIVGTDFTFGFHTAVQTATHAIDRLHTTAQSHDRVMVIEVMGRNTGWIAVFAGIAGGADAVLIPELESTVEDIADGIKQRHQRGKDFSIVVAAEGAKLVFANGEKREILEKESDGAYGYPRLGGVGSALAQELESRTGFETRTTTLGHVQRGGTPTAYDRVLATRYGVRAAELVIEESYGKMVALKGTAIEEIPLEDVQGVKTVDLEYLEVARTFFG